MRNLQFHKLRRVLQITVIVGAAILLLLSLQNESSLSITDREVPELSKATWHESGDVEGSGDSEEISDFEESSDVEDDSRFSMDEEAIGRRFLLRKELNIKGCQKIGDNRNKGGIPTRLYYNKEHKLLICAPKKTGCSTVRKQLLRLSGRLDHIRHLSAEASKLIVAKAMLDKEELREVLVEPSVIRAVVARHPLDRLVSGYKDKFKDGEKVTSTWRSTVKKYKDIMGLNTTDVSLTFLQYLQMIIHFKNGGGGLDDHFRPTFYKCCPCDVNYAYVFQTDTLSEDFAYVSRRYQLPNIDQGLRVNNKTSSRPYEDYYKDIPGDVIREIYSIYEKDFLSYNFELPPSLRGFLEKEDLPLV